MVIGIVCFGGGVVLGMALVLWRVLAHPVIGPIIDREVLGKSLDEALK